MTGRPAAPERSSQPAGHPNQATAQRARPTGRNPYVGPRAFEEEEQEFFFGRDEEIAILEGLVMARRAVLFFAQSGAGKSSLLKAGLIPSLTRRQRLGRGRHGRSTQKMQVLPILGVGGTLPTGLEQAIGNAYIFSALYSLRPDADPADLATQTLADGLAPFLATPTARPADHPISPSPPLPVTPSPSPSDTLLIFDQFEELFTHHPARWHEREDFFQQVRQALEAYPSLHVLFTMREDYIAELTPYAGLLPEQLRPRFRLERLKRDAALQAVIEPARRGDRTFAPGVAEALVDNLRRLQVKRQQAGQALTETILGTYVEPVHLQIVCHQLWDSLPAGRRTIELEDLQEFGDVDQALIGFYEAALAQVVAHTGVSERRLRAWIDEHLITPAHTRGLVYRGETASEGLPNAAVDLLRDAYVIRATIRGGDTWYELAHDRLVEPILAANQAWQEQHRSPLTLATEAWLASGKDAGLLYRGRQLDEARTQLALAPDELTEQEREFIRTSHELATEQAQTRQRRLLLGSGLLLVVFASLFAWSLVSFRTAARQSSLAQAASTAAVASERTALAERALAQAASTAAVQSANTAVAERATAQAASTVAAAALATSEAHLEAALTAQAPPGRTPTVVPAGQETPESPGEPTPTPTPNLTVIAQQTQLVQVRATQTALAAAPTITPTPRATPAPTLLAVAFPPPGRIVFASNRSSHADLYVMNADGSGVSRLTQNLGWEPSYARGSDMLVFTAKRGDDVAALFTIRPDGSNERNIDGRVYDNWEPSFSGDGRRVAFVSSRDGQWEIYSMNPDGSDVRRLTDHPAGDTVPAFSPDGQRIAFASDREVQLDQPEIWVMNADGSNPLRLTFNQAFDSYPAWSPDGQQIAFASNRDGNLDIWVMNADGSDPRNVTQSASDENYPAWSPDGQWLAFSRYVGNNEIFVITIDGQHLTNVTNHAGDDWAPTWLP